MLRARTLLASLFVAAAALAAEPLRAQQPDSTAVVPAAAQPVNGHLNVDAATRAYLATLPLEAKARSDAYFEGGYWIDLWSYLITAVLMLVLLRTGLSARLRDLAARVVSWPTGQTFIYWVLFAALVAAVTFPFDVYVGFVREHHYGLSTQAFGAWLLDWAKGFFVVTLGFTGIVLVVLYAVLRRVGRAWWIWGAGVFLVFLFVGVVLGPVLIVPLFNHPKLLENPQVTQPILRLARANGIEVSNVYEIDASQQSTRISANVSGALGTERITLNDNLLHRATLPQIEAVMGHEMGHYVLHHVYKGFLAIGVVLVIGFALVAWSFERLRACHEPRWRVRSVSDEAGLPLGALLFSTYLFIMTPVLNTIVRTSEAEADIFGLNAAGQPDAFAQIAVKLSEYRKLDPSPLEEALFYDHPSGRTRIHTAMRWKAEHLGASDGSSAGH